MVELSLDLEAKLLWAHKDLF